MNEGYTYFPPDTGFEIRLLVFFSGCYAMFCWTCFVAQMSNRMNENACGEIFCGPMFISHLRTKLRTLYGIRVSFHLIKQTIIH